jgi:hypothetical protein
MVAKTQISPAAAVAVVYALTKDDIAEAKRLASQFLVALKDEDRAEGLLALAKEGKWATIRGIGFRACKDGKMADGRYDRNVAVAAFKELGEAFDAALVQADRENRQNPGEPMPDARELVKIDGSIRAYKSIVRKAVEAGYVILGSESKSDLQRASGNVATGNAGTPAGRGARPPAGMGDEPANVTKGSDALSNVLPALAEVMKALAAEATAASPANQAILAECLIDALGSYKDRIAVPTEVAAPAPQVQLTAAQQRKTKARKAA